MLISFSNFVLQHWLNDIVKLTQFKLDNIIIQSFPLLIYSFIIFHDFLCYVWWFIYWRLHFCYFWFLFSVFLNFNFISVATKLLIGVDKLYFPYTMKWHVMIKNELVFTKHWQLYIRHQGLFVFFFSLS